MANAQDTVLTFHDHFNAGRVDEVLAMATEDITVGGRGGSNGRQLLNEWIGRKTTTLTPQRWFEKDDLVVIEELVEWRTRNGDRVTDSTLWGMAFNVEDGKIARIVRYADIGEAVTSNGLFEADEVKLPGKRRSRKRAQQG
jgi:hypothetical protein